jgi:hypothetical protein
MSGEDTNVTAPPLRVTETTEARRCRAYAGYRGVGAATLHALA